MCEILDRVEQRGIKKGIQQGIQQGLEQGLEQGERSTATLFSFLLANDRLADLKRAANDKAYRHKLMSELFPNQ